MLRVKQRGMKYNFFSSLWYNSTWDWTPVFRAIGEHSTYLTKGIIPKINVITRLEFEHAYYNVSVQMSPIKS